MGTIHLGTCVAFHHQQLVCILSASWLIITLAYSGNNNFQRFVEATVSTEADHQAGHPVLGLNRGPFRKSKDCGMSLRMSWFVCLGRKGGGVKRSKGSWRRVKRREAAKGEMKRSSVVGV